MDLDFVDCLPYFSGYGGTGRGRWGFAFGCRIVQWHTPFDWLIFGFWQQKTACAVVAT